MKIRFIRNVARRALFIVGCGLLSTSWLFYSATPGWSAGPPNVVTNGTFSSNTAYWKTDLITTTFNNTGCTSGYGIAYLANSTLPNIDAYQHCIHILTPPAGDSWTLEGDGRLLDGDIAYLQAIFFSSTNCGTGNLGQLDTPYFTYGAMNHKSASKIVAGVNSVRVFLKAGDSFMGAVEACFDNISLGGANATLVQLQEVKAYPAQPTSSQLQLSGGLALAGLLILALQVSLKRKAE